MEKHTLTMGTVELETLNEWIKTFDPPPLNFKLIGGSSGIGFCLRAEVETAEGEGKFKDLTDYENW
jgi:hypothetical protein